MGGNLKIKLPERARHLRDPLIEEDHFCLFSDQFRDRPRARQHAALWTAQQIIEAFPEETAPPFLLRDRDQIYGEHFRCRVVGMGIEEVVTAAQSPWQNSYAERLIGSIRRECCSRMSD